MNNNILGCVYIIKCIKNNKVYVGQTIDIKNGKLKNYKKVAQKYQIAVATIMNLIKYGETYNPSNYKH